MTRIKYTKSELGLTTVPILVNNSWYMCTITPQFTCVFSNNKSEDTLIFQGKNLAECKRIVKKEFKRLGARFYDEVRRRK